jgi:glycosyltransferase involved in cell wall biosynthesis
MESIVNQTLREIEIIIVDAGSSDGTLEVLSWYAKRDNRIRILHSDKKSMGYQYNIGINASTGEYIGFVETDDYIHLNMYEELYSVACEHNVDYIKSDFDLFIDISCERLSLTKKLMTGKNAGLYGEVIQPSEYPDLINTDVNIWNGIYYKEFLTKNDIVFNETPGAAFQDMGFVLQTLVFAKRTIYVDQSFYRYRRDNAGSSVYNKNTLKFAIWEFEYIQCRFNNNYPEYYRVPESLIYSRFFNLFASMLQRNSLRRDLSSGDFEEDIQCFSELFHKGFKKLDKAKCSWMGLGLLHEIEILFSSTPEQFYSRHKKSAQVGEKLLYKWTEFLKQQSEIILFGAGNIGSYVYCYLKRCGIDIVGFCDNKEKRFNTDYMGKKIFSLKEASKAYPNAMYVTTTAAAENIKKQLVSFGIQDCNICNYYTPINIYSAFELDFREKNV